MKDIFKVDFDEDDVFLEKDDENPAKLLDILKAAKEKLQSCEKPDGFEKTQLHFDLWIYDVDRAEKEAEEYEKWLEEEDDEKEKEKEEDNGDYPELEDDDYDDGTRKIEIEEFPDLAGRWEQIFLDIYGVSDEGELRVEVGRAYKDSDWEVTVFETSLATWDSLLDVLKECQIISKKEAKELRL